MFFESSRSGLLQLLEFLLNYKNLYLHGLDIKESDVVIIHCIDDSVCTNQDFDCCQKDNKIITDNLDQLGITINQEKSVLIPCQRIVFFGVIID